MSEKLKLKDVIGGSILENSQMADTLAIALCTYFEKHLECPEDDPVDDEKGWGVWVIGKTEEALGLIVVDIDAYFTRPAPSDANLQACLKDAVQHNKDRADDPSDTVAKAEVSDANVSNAVEQANAYIRHPESNCGILTIRHITDLIAKVREQDEKLYAYDATGYPTIQETIDKLQADNKALKRSKHASDSVLLEMCTDFEQACQIARRMSVADLRPYVLEALKIARQNGLSGKIEKLKKGGRNE